ncbi:MAG TPA: hypothetical protein VN862_05130 [Candidatus Acidoferrales bacterium]|nr:hypothetical protein [Candidatus Acidoferrales bacterium]
MANSFVIFDFGKNEEAAQQARRKLEQWRQAFHLDKKMQYKFERHEAEQDEAEAEADAEKGSEKRAAHKKKSAKRAEEADSASIRIVVRLSFSDHEKLSQQRWLERLPTEEPFKDASPKVLHAGDADFDETTELFESLDRSKPAGPRS